jgi:predicted ester cyclase
VGVHGHPGDDGPARHRARSLNFRKEEDLLLVDGDYFTVVYRWTGTHEGEFAGVPATGNTVESLALGRLERDELAEMWIYGDSAGVVAQLDAA